MAKNKKRGQQKPASQSGAASADGPGAQPGRQEGEKRLRESPAATPAGVEKKKTRTEVWGKGKKLFDDKGEKGKSKDKNTVKVPPNPEDITETTEFKTLRLCFEELKKTSDKTKELIERAVDAGAPKAFIHDMRQNLASELKIKARAEAAMERGNKKACKNIKNQRQANIRQVQNDVIISNLNVKVDCTEVEKKIVEHTNTQAGTTVVTNNMVSVQKLSRVSKDEEGKDKVKYGAHCCRFTDSRMKKHFFKGLATTKLKDMVEEGRKLVCKNRVPSHLLKRNDHLEKVAAKLRKEGKVTKITFEKGGLYLNLKQGDTWVKMEDKNLDLEIERKKKKDEDGGGEGEGDKGDEGEDME